tara:strand:- start:794 stop:1129 length:336 start_codon:yes stop_codon:yes gene_type:complete
MKLYGLKNCDTCKKALKALMATGRQVTFIDVRVDGINYKKLTKFYTLFQDSLVNTRSTTWRSLSLEERQRAPLELLMDNPTLMKRPVIECDELSTLGWNKDTEKTVLEKLL